MTKKGCSIYENRPDVCRNFPVSTAAIEEFSECGYYFENGTRKGECNGCGQCCIDMRWDGVKDKICRYRINGET
jgi:Fe-S-cluster containining protein